MGLQKIGALWKKKTQKDNTSYLSGVIEVVAGVKMYVKVLPYTVKEGTEKAPNSPDYNILIQIEDKPEKEESKESDDI